MCAEWLLNDYDEIPKDKTEALMWLEKAAVAGEKDAMLYMAEICEYGLDNGVYKSEKNFDKAKYWYQQLADNGEETAVVYVKLMENKKVDPSGKPLTWGGKRAFAGILKEYYPEFNAADVLYSANDDLFNTQFSESDVDEFLQADENIRLLCQTVLFCKTAYRQGLLAFEDEIENVQDQFLKTALRLSVDGIDPEEVQKILQTITAAENPSGLQLLSKQIIMQGTFCMQNGKDPMLQFKSLLGEKTVSLLHETFPDAEKHNAEENYDDDEDDDEGPLMDTEVEHYGD
jgi:hypothetical protein